MPAQSDRFRAKPRGGPAARPIRVALVCTELRVGGTERQVANLIERLDRNRFAPRLFVLAPPPRGARGELAERLRQAGADVRWLDAVRPWHGPRAWRRLRAGLLDWRPHAVLAFLFHANLFAALAAPRRTPLAMSVRAAEPSRWRAAVQRRVGRRAARWVAVSQAVADQLARRGAALGPITVIPNGINVDAYGQAPPADLAAWGLPRDAAPLLFAGRLERQKGLDRFLEHAPGLFRRAPEARLLVAGEGSERRRLTRRAAQLGIADRIVWLGWRNDIPRLLAASRLLVLPSRWEGMPNAVLEAMAAGRPVAAAAVEGVQELLGAAAAEQTVPPDRPDQLETLVVELLRRPERARQLGAANRQRAASRFSLDRMVVAYERLLAELADGRLGVEAGRAKPE